MATSHISGPLDSKNGFEIDGVAITATAAELNLIDGSIAGTSVASKALALGANKNTDVLALPVSGLKIGAGAGTAVTTTAAELNTLASVVAGTTTASKALVVGASKNLDTVTVASLKVGASAVLLPDSATLAPAAGASNVCLVTITVVDGAGTAVTRPVVLDIWLSDAATGLGVTGTTASGAVAAGATGTDLVDLTSKKVKKVITSAAGVYILSITDTAKTGFYVAANIPGSDKISVSAQLVTGNYGA